MIHICDAALLVADQVARNAHTDGYTNAHGACCHRHSRRRDQSANIAAGRGINDHITGSRGHGRILDLGPHDRVQAVGGFSPRARHGHADLANSDRNRRRHRSHIDRRIICGRDGHIAGPGHNAVGSVNRRRNPACDIVMRQRHTNRDPDANLAQTHRNRSRACKGIDQARICGIQRHRVARDHGARLSGQIARDRGPHVHIDTVFVVNAGTADGDAGLTTRNRDRPCKGQRVDDLPSIRIKDHIPTRAVDPRVGDQGVHLSRIGRTAARIADQVTRNRDTNGHTNPGAAPGAHRQRRGQDRRVDRAVRCCVNGDIPNACHIGKCNARQRIRRHHVLCIGPCTRKRHGRAVASRNRQGRSRAECGNVALAHQHDRRAGRKDQLERAAIIADRCKGQGTGFADPGDRRHLLVSGQLPVEVAGQAGEDHRIRSGIGRHAEMQLFVGVAIAIHIASVLAQLHLFLGCVLQVTKADRGQQHRKFRAASGGRLDLQPRSAKHIDIRVQNLRPHVIVDLVHRDRHAKRIGPREAADTYTNAHRRSRSQRIDGVVICRHQLGRGHIDVATADIGRHIRRDTVAHKRSRPASRIAALADRNTNSTRRNQRRNRLRRGGLNHQIRRDTACALHIGVDHMRRHRRPFAGQADLAPEVGIAVIRNRQIFGIGQGLAHIFEILAAMRTLGHMNHVPSGHDNGFIAGMVGRGGRRRLGIADLVIRDGHAHRDAKRALPRRQRHRRRRRQHLGIQRRGIVSGDGDLISLEHRPFGGCCGLAENTVNRDRATDRNRWRFLPSTDRNPGRNANRAGVDHRLAIRGNENPPVDRRDRRTSRAAVQHLCNHVRAQRIPGNRRRHGNGGRVRAPPRSRQREGCRQNMGINGRDILGAHLHIGCRAAQFGRPIDQSLGPAGPTVQRNDRRNRKARIRLGPQGDPGGHGRIGDLRVDIHGRVGLDQNHAIGLSRAIHDPRRCEAWDFIGRQQAEQRINGVEQEVLAVRTDRVKGQRHTHPDGGAIAAKCAGGHIDIAVDQRRVIGGHHDCAAGIAHIAVHDLGRGFGLYNVGSDHRIDRNHRARFARPNGRAAGYFDRAAVGGRDGRIFQRADQHAAAGHIRIRVRHPRQRRAARVVHRDHAAHTGAAAGRGIEVQELGDKAFEIKRFNQNPITVTGIVDRAQIGLGADDGAAAILIDLTRGALGALGRIGGVVRRDQHTLAKPHIALAAGFRGVVIVVCQRLDHAGRNADPAVIGHGGHGLQRVYCINPVAIVGNDGDAIARIQIILARRTGQKRPVTVREILGPKVDEPGGAGVFIDHIAINHTLAGLDIFGAIGGREGRHIYVRLGRARHFVHRDVQGIGLAPRPLERISSRGGRIAQRSVDIRIICRRDRDLAIRVNRGIQHISLGINRIFAVKRGRNLGRANQSINRVEQDVRRAPAHGVEREDPRDILRTRFDQQLVFRDQGRGIGGIHIHIARGNPVAPSIQRRSQDARARPALHNVGGHNRSGGHAGALPVQRRTTGRAYRAVDQRAHQRAFVGQNFDIAIGGLHRRIANFRLGKAAQIVHHEQRPDRAAFGFRLVQAGGHDGRQWLQLPEIGIGVINIVDVGRRVRVALISAHIDIDLARFAAIGIAVGQPHTIAIAQQNRLRTRGARLPIHRQQIIAGFLQHRRATIIGGGRGVLEFVVGVKADVIIGRNGHRPARHNLFAS